MQITVTGKQIDVGDSLRGRAEAETRAIIEKYFDKAIEAHVVFSRERHLYSSDISVRGGRGLLVQCRGQAVDAHAAFDGASERLEKQLRRYKRRLRNHHRNPKSGEEAESALAAIDYVLARSDEEEGGAESGDQPLVIAELRTSIPRLSVSEAVMRLDLADAPALLFRNSKHGNFNLVYRRPDGNIGWIDPDLAGLGGAAGSRKSS
jgi:ribosomal subunit interface protein